MKDISLSGNSKFSYDSQGRLKSTEGLGNSSQSWGKIEYSYSVGGKIEKIIRSGNFVKNRLNDGFDTLEDTYSYSEQNQLGVLQSVMSRSGNQSALLKFTHDSLGYRQSGVSPTLTVFKNANTSSKPSTNWTNINEIPMQKYVWNGRGNLAGVFAAMENSNQQVEVNELLNYRMSDEKGYQLAEFDAVTLNEILGDDGKVKRKEVEFVHLPRNVQFSNGISFERDEIHFDIQIGHFASLRFITRYPALNASNPDSLSKQEMQTRKELVLKDLVGSVTQILDIDSHKIVEKNASEPFGLNKGLPLLTNNILSEFKNENRRSDPQLYLNSQSNMRDNWEIKSYEILNSSNLNNLDKQGMRSSKSFAKGMFSASTGLHSMGVRAYDPALGLWMSPDLFIGQSLELMFSKPLEANLYQYAANNPIVLNDPSGMLSWGGLKDKIKDAANGKVGAGGHDMSKSPGSSGGGGLGGRSDYKQSNSGNFLNKANEKLSSLFSNVSWSKVSNNMGPWGPKIKYFANYAQTSQSFQTNLKITSDFIEVASFAMFGAGLVNSAYQGITKASSIVNFFQGVARNPGILTSKFANKPNFVVTKNGVVIPIPKNASGPVPVVNNFGKVTGFAYTEGIGGLNGHVKAVRIMDSTLPKGASPGYPNGYVKYQNGASPKPQGVDPYTGKVKSNKENHYPL